MHSRRRSRATGAPGIRSGSRPFASNRVRGAVAAVAGLVILSLLSLGIPGRATAETQGPALQADPAALDRSLVCQGDLAASQATPVVLLPGTASNPVESFRSGYVPALTALGFPVCTVEFPDRSMADIQASAEYVVHAVRDVSSRAGRPVALVGHSQGGVSALWALRFWPDLASHVTDLVGVASPFSGSSLANAVCQGLGCPAAIWQQRVGSTFLARLTADPLPGGPAYTSIATFADEIVTPTPQATRLEGARNIVLQDICPARPVDHITLLYDSLAFSLIVDALRNEGPADPGRMPASTCAMLTIPLGSPTLLTDSALGILNLLTAYGQAFAGSMRLPAEPPLMPYATNPTTATETPPA